VKERPILFSAPMVRALLAGKKTQTRRIVKPRKDRDFGCEIAPCELAGEVNAGEYRNAYCAPGDRLWVRERGWIAQSKTAFIPFVGNEQGATPTSPNGDPYKVCPSIHTPRWASRITLEVTAVRVERLQDISVQDAVAEGAPPSHPSIDAVSREFGYPDFPRSWYGQLWEQINGPDSWDANPWVWVVEFKRIEGGAA
jgi:hypothetical protein